MKRCRKLLCSLLAGLMLTGSVTCPAAESESQQTAVPTYGYKVVSRCALIANTQGLEIHDGRLGVVQACTASP